jgi:cytochrome c oxidase assembly factor 4
MKLTDCYYDKKDWRACKKEVSGSFKLRSYVAHSATSRLPSHSIATATATLTATILIMFQMEVFRACWKRHNNDQRTATKDA